MITFADWEEWVVLALGLWLIASPWALHFPASAAMKIHIGAGLLLVYVAGLELWLIGLGSATEHVRLLAHALRLRSAPQLAGHGRHIKAISEHPGQNEKNDEHVCGKEHDALDEPTIGPLVLGPSLLRGGRSVVSHVGCPVIFSVPHAEPRTGLSCWRATRQAEPRSKRA
jgi:hypothetical protein